MEKPPKRSVRRHHRERLKQSRKHYWSLSEHKPQRIIDTPCCCSCEMCGNPRRGWNKELTMQEKRSDEAWASEEK